MSRRTKTPQASASAHTMFICLEKIFQSAHRRNRSCPTVSWELGDEPHMMVSDSWSDITNIAKKESGGNQILIKKIHVTVWSTSSPRRQVNINNTAQFLSSTCLLIITESGGRVMAEYLTTGLQIVTGFIEKGAGTVTKRVERPRQA